MIGATILRELVATEFPPDGNFRAAGAPPAGRVGAAEGGLRLPRRKHSLNNHVHTPREASGSKTPNGRMRLIGEVHQRLLGGTSLLDNCAPTATSKDNQVPRNGRRARAG